MIRGNPVSLRRVLRLAIRGALAGLLSAAVALGVAELVAGITGPLSSPVIAVGGVAINLTPVPLKDFAIAHFGSNDKNVLAGGDRGAARGLRRGDRDRWPFAGSGSASRGWRCSARSGWARS